MEGISNIEIDDFLKDARIKNYKGVYSCNKLPCKAEVQSWTDFCIICNLSKENETGTHFIAIASFQNVIYYLDSLALNATIHNYIKKFIAELNKDFIVTLASPIQEKNSEHCGYYTIFFCLYYANQFSTSSGINNRKDINKFSSTNLLLNDSICINNIKKLTGITNHVLLNKGIK